MAGIRRVVAPIAVLLAVLVVGAPVAHAIGRPGAVAIALRALSPGRVKGPVRVFALPNPLPRGQFVYEAGLARTQFVRPLPFPVWVFWEDEAAGALFAHPSVLLLLDARTGQVVTRQSMLWFLYVGEKLAPFLRTKAGYNSPNYVVYPAIGHSRRIAATRTRGPPLGTTAAYAKAKNRRAALSHDCLITIGDFRAKEFSGGLAAMYRFAVAVGMRTFDISPGLASFTELKLTVDTAHRSGCTDQLLYIAGHGRFPSAFWKGGQFLRVINKFTHKPVEQLAGANVHPAFHLNRTTGEQRDDSDYITPENLIKLVRPYAGTFRHVDFKIKIDSCFAGRFETVINSSPNVVAMEFGARKDEEGWWFGGPARVQAADPKTHEFNGKFETNRVDNPDGATTFVNANVHGLMDWAANAPLDSPLVTGIMQALDRGKAYDFARTIGWTHPYAKFNQPFVEPQTSLYSGGAGMDNGDNSIAATRGGRHSADSRSAPASASGTIAFSEMSASKISLMDTAGNLTEYPTAPGAAPQEIALGPDGNFWFTEYDTKSSNAAIGRITPSGIVSTYDLPESLTMGGLGSGIAAGPDGNLWFTERTNDKIGVMSTSGVLLHEYTVRAAPPMFFQLYLIARGPDGNMWFTESGNAIGRITMSGAVTEFPITAGRVAFGITAGPDGKIWIALQGGIAGIARINADGTGYKEYLDPDKGFPNQIAAGPDGNLWYVDYANSSQGGNQIGRITPSGQINEYSRGLPADSAPVAITAGPDGRMWFTLQHANQVGAITTG